MKLRHVAANYDKFLDSRPSGSIQFSLSKRVSCSTYHPFRFSNEFGRVRHHLRTVKSDAFVAQLSARGLNQKLTISLCEHAPDANGVP